MFLTTESSLKLSFHSWSSSRIPPTSIRPRRCSNRIKEKGVTDSLPEAWLSLETSDISTVWNWD